MTNLFDAKKVTREVNRCYRVLNDYPMADNGYRLRVTEKARMQGDSFAELGASYFYRDQASMSQALENVNFYARYAELGVKFRAVGEVYYDDANWPKTSWVTMLVEVVADSVVEDVCPRG